MFIYHVDAYRFVFILFCSNSWIYCCLLYWNSTFIVEQVSYTCQNTGAATESTFLALNFDGVSPKYYNTVEPEYVRLQSGDSGTGVNGNCDCANLLPTDPNYCNAGWANLLWNLPQSSPNSKINTSYPSAIRSIYTFPGSMVPLRFTTLAFPHHTIGLLFLYMPAYFQMPLFCYHYRRHVHWYHHQHSAISKQPACNRTHLRWGRRRFGARQC